MIEGNALRNFGLIGHDRCDRTRHLLYPGLGLAGLVAALVLLTPLKLVLMSFLGISISIQAAHDTQIVRDRAVYLTGQVGDRVPLVDAQIYQLSDRTGQIWVVTPDTTLQSGEQVTIRGTVRFQAMEVTNGQSGEVYIEEQRQIKRHPTP